MSSGKSAPPLAVPPELQEQLHGYRRHVWKIKMIEASAVAIVALVVAFLFVYSLDRLVETPLALRIAAFFIAACGMMLIPWFGHRWLWRHRSFEQLARLLRTKLPQVGDQLLGIFELSRNEQEQARSRTLCEAAIRQVATDATHRNLLEAAPQSHYRFWGTLAGCAVCLATMMAVLFPAAATNAWLRMLAPWRATERYTFTQIEPLPSPLIVPHGEPFTIETQLRASTRTQPAAGQVQIGRQQPLTASLTDQGYAWTAPAQIARTTLNLRVGDFLQNIDLEPRLRPELQSVTAQVQLPEYLQQSKPLQFDVRGGSLSVVEGSTAVFTAIANRPLTHAAMNGEAISPDSDRLATPAQQIDQSQSITLTWSDADGLAGREPFQISVNALPDELPSVVGENLPRQAVMLESEVLNFLIRASDDFGIKRVGIEWRSLEEVTTAPIRGERVLAAGGYDQVSLEAQGTFSAASLGIPAQPIELRVWAEDFFPHRERTYSPPSVLYILTADEHAIWMAEQLNKWHRQSLEVRDRELQLYEVNKKLRELSAEEMDTPETRQRIEGQAAAEQANGRRLDALTQMGENLVRQASRNSQIGVGHLDRWAEMLQVLKDISSNRMPTVTDLLKTAANAPKKGKTEDSGPTVGQVRTTAGGAGSDSKPEDSPKLPAVPSVVDVESSQQPPADPAEKETESESAGAKSKKGRLGLAQTTLIGPGGKPEKPQESAEEAIEEAVTEQENLLAEFEKVADALNEVLANLEGSTLVKRLKAASREQFLIAGRVTETLDNVFGKLPSGVPEEDRALFEELATRESKSSQDVSNIMDDMQAYFERRRFMKFGTILEEMKETDVIDGLRQLGTDIPKEQGLSVAQAEFWSDTLDRWAEDLVDPASSGSCKGSKTPDSLPPSVVLEVLQVLEAEVNLREETRVAQQAKGAQTDDEYLAEAKRLSEQQRTLGGRIGAVITRIEELPGSEEHFGKDLELLAEVRQVMSEATKILSLPNTGAQAIAAETEAIELLLQSKRINPKGGGGGGTNPGGGGTGTTEESALALLGSGFNDKEVKDTREVQQAVGEAGSGLPTEFRAGLDEYFNRL